MDDGLIWRLTPLLFFAGLATGWAQTEMGGDSPGAEIEVLHMWRTDSEQNALAVYRDALQETGVRWADYAVEHNFEGINQELTGRLAIDSPPSAVQWIVTKNMSTLVENGVFRLIDDSDGKYQKLLRPEVYDLVKMDGGLSGIPVGIHTQNVIVYNKSIMTEFDLKPADSWEELAGYGPLLAEKNVHLIAASNEEWQLRVMFMSVLAATMSVEEFGRFQTEGQAIDDLKDHVARAFGILESLRRYSNPEYQDLLWEEVTKIVADGAALVQLLGDYIVPEFPDRNNIICDQAPGSRYTIWGVDSFVFPVVGADNVIAGQNAFLDAVTARENVLDYVARKGGLPIVSDVLPEMLDDCLAGILAGWNDTSSRIVMGGETWQKRFGVVGSYLRRHWSSGFADSARMADELVEILGAI